MQRCREILILLLIFFLFFGYQLTAQDQWLRLYGTVEDKLVKLYWEPNGWPVEIEGFNIKRRIIVADSLPGQWSKLNSRSIIPSISTHKDFANQGLNNNQINDTKQTLEKYLEAGAIQTMEEEILLEILKEKGGLGSGDKIRMVNDFNLAIIIGFAFIDNTYENSLTCEYGIFPVSKSGIESEEAEAICRVGKLELLEFPLEFERLKNGISVNWKLLKDSYRLHNLIGFKIYKSATDSLKMEFITASFGSYKEDDNYFYFHHIDTYEDHDKDIFYGIAPLTIFQNELERITRLFIAEAYKPLSPPKIKEILLVDELFSLVKWEIIPIDSGRIKGYIIEISQNLTDKGFLAISDTLCASSFEFTDSIIRNYGEIYSYRIKAFDAYANTSYSEPKSVFYLGLIKPAPVKNIISSTFMKDGNNNVSISWSPKATDDSITKGYIIFSDEILPDTFLQLASVSLIKDTFYIHKITNQGGRDYKFRIIPLSIHGAYGPMTEVVQYVGLNNLPSFENFAVKLLGGNTAEVIWKYPNVKDLQGFRLYMNDKEIAGPDVINDTIRKFLVKNIKPGDGSLCRFMIEALGTNDLSRKSLTQSLLISNYNPSEIMPPDSLRVAFEMKDSLKYALLRWAKEDLDSLGLQGYVLYVDYAFEGSVLRLSSLPLITGNYYWYKLPDNPERKKYTFRLAAMSKTQEIGQYAETVLNLPDEPSGNIKSDKDSKKIN